MKDLMVMKVGGGSLSRLSGDGDLVLFAADLSFFFVCILFHVVFFSTWNFISYLCCEKLFLSFEALFQYYQVSEAFLALLSPCHSQPHLFCSPALYSYFIHHSHRLPVGFGCDFSTQPRLPWAGGLYLTHFRSSLASTVSSPGYFLKWAEWLTP